MILVGDSGGMVNLGYDTTIPVTMDQMINMAQAVRRGAPDKFLVGDLPKGSYEASDEVAVANAMRFIKEAGCDAVKLEGAGPMVRRVKAIVESGIQAIGHIGLTPQTSAQFGGYRVVGKNDQEFLDLQRNAKELENAGASLILLEAVPESIGASLTENGNCIYMGIGAGKSVHGQLLILHDILGLYPNFRPKFSKNFFLEALPTFMKSLPPANQILSYGRETREDGFFAITKIAVEIYIHQVTEEIYPDQDYIY